MVTRASEMELMDEVWFMIVSDFGGDEEAASEWIRVQRTAFGGLSAMQMVHTGQILKLHGIITNLIGMPEEGEDVHD